MDDGNFSSDSLEPDRQLEQQWVKAVQHSDKKAFKKIFESYYDPLTRFAFRYLKSGAEAEGVVQELFLWIWEKREEWQVEGTLKTYLFRAVKHKALDCLRHEEVKTKYIREYIQRREKSMNPDIKIESEDDKEKFVQAVQEAIEALPERARIIYKMSRLEGLTYNEIADVLEISPKTVESQMSRALDILRTKLSKYLKIIFMIKMVHPFF